MRRRIRQTPLHCRVCNDNRTLFYPVETLDVPGPVRIQHVYCPQCMPDFRLGPADLNTLPRYNPAPGIAVLAPDMAPEVISCLSCGSSNVAIFRMQMTWYEWHTDTGTVMIENSGDSDFCGDWTFSCRDCEHEWLVPYRVNY